MSNIAQALGSQSFYRPLLVRARPTNCAIHPSVRTHLQSLPRGLIFLIFFSLEFFGACRDRKPTEELVVFAAASTADAMTEIGHAFSAKDEGSASFSFGASGDLARQIRAGAPADVLISADAEIVNELVRDHIALRGGVKRLASNRLVVIVPAESRLDMSEPRRLREVARIALGDPAVVPAGRYAKRWLEGAGIWDGVREHLVPTLDVRAALSAVEAGRADAGIVYATDAATSTRVRIAYRVPPESAPAIAYVAARLERSKLASADRFLEFLTSDEARLAFKRHGFIVEGSP
jgi:molybdate transport system substrate-binding protein